MAVADVSVILGHSSCPSRLARFTVDGRIDKSFGLLGRSRALRVPGPTDFADLAVQANGKIVAMGRSFRRTADWLVARYLSK